MNLSPFLLKAQLVSGRTWALRVLNNLKSCSFFSSIFEISSLLENAYFELDFSIGLSCSRLLLALSGLFRSLAHPHPFYICTHLYSEDRFSRSIDFVSISPLLRTYSRRIPGG
jgi:hypothetical protein